MNERYQAVVKVIAIWYEDKKFTNKKKYDPKNDWNPKLFIVRANILIFFIKKGNFIYKFLKFNRKMHCMISFMKI